MKCNFLAAFYKVINQGEIEKQLKLYDFYKLKGILAVILLKLIVLVGRVFAYGPGDMGSIPGCVIPKTLKMVLNTSLFNTAIQGMYQW